MVTSSPVFTGVGVALVTIFDSDGELLAQETAAHAARLVGEGVRAVVVAGTTGEAFSLDPDERSAVLCAVREEVGGRVPVIAGTGAPSTRAAVALSKRAASDGADAVLALAPAAVQDPRDYYEQLAAAIDVPLLGYHFPNVSPPGIPIEGLADLPIAGLKDSSGDPERLILEVLAFPEGVYTGHYSLLLHASGIGCSGAILALANLDVGGCVKAWEGDPEAQRQLVADHHDLSGIPALKRKLAAELGIDPSIRIG